MTLTIDHDLDRHIATEWDEGYAHLPIPGDWTIIDTALRGMSTLRELLDALGPGGDLQDSDRVYLALITRAQAGETVAGRVLVQRLQPRCRQLFATAAKRGLEDPAACSYTAAWAAIMTFPLTRTTKVRINLSMRVLNKMPEQTDDPTPIAADDLGPMVTAEAGDISPTTETAKLLLWALDHDVITQAEGALLYRATIATPTSVNAALSEIAAEEGVTSRAMHGRYSKVVKKISDAVSHTV